MDPNKVTYFAVTDARNKRVKFGIKAKDRTKHMYVIGKTGMGKSFLLENLAIQDIQNGEGLAFIDPHGGTAEKLLDYVPEHRIKDVLYFAPFDLDNPVSFNVLEDIGVDKRHLVVNGLMSTFEKIWVDAWSARMAYILQYTLLALLEYPEATLLSVNRMLVDKEYRKKVVDNVKDPSVRAFWIEEFGKYTERFAAEATPAIQNKVGQFTSNPLVRNLIGQPDSSFDIRKFMDEKKILIINLSKGLVGEGNANLIGSMLITKIYLAAMSRADKNEQELAKLPNFYLYVDEFQSFANKSFADILSEARKYKLNLTIAHQYVEQMEEEVRDAVFGNAGTIISFRVGAFDSEVLEKEFAPVFTAEDLVNLGKYQIYLKLMIDGVASQPFSATTMEGIVRPEITFKNEVIESSRKQFTHPRVEVEKAIQDWHDEGTSKEVRPMSQGENSRGYENNGGNGNRNGRDNGRNGNNNQQSLPLQKPYSPMSGSTPVQTRAPSSSEYPPKQTPSSVSIPAQTQTSAEDPNKTAFMKAAEELRSKMTPPEGKQEDLKVPLGSENTTRSNLVRPETASLSNLKNDSRNDNKKPSAENISHLKDALSRVMKKPEAEKASPLQEKSEKKPEENGEKIEKQPEAKTESRTESQTTTTKNSTTSAAGHEDRGPEPQSPLPKGTATSAEGREVPEDVLRKILDIDDNKK